MNNVTAYLADFIGNPRAALQSLLDKALGGQNRPLIKIEFPGWVIIISSLLIGGVAYNTGNNLVFIVLSLTLSLIIVSGILSRFNLRKLVTTLHSPPVIFSDNPAVIALAIDHRDRAFPVFGIGYALEIKRLDPDTMRPLDDPPVFEQKVYFAQIAPGKTSEKKIILPPLKRGLYQICVKTVRSGYPFGFFLKQAPYHLEKNLVVHPRMVHLDRNALPAVKKNGVTTRLEPGEGVDLLSIRNYNPGDPLRRIHWKASAKAGRYLIRELAREQSPVISLFLPLTSSREEAGSYEKAIRLTASLCKLLLENHFVVGLATPRGNIPPRKSPHQLQLMIEHLTRLPALPDPPFEDPAIPPRLPASAIYLCWQDHHARAQGEVIDLRNYDSILTRETP